MLVSKISTITAFSAVSPMLRVKYFPPFCLIAVISVISLDQICFAGINEKDEIIYAVPHNAIPAIKNPEFVPATEVFNLN